MLDSDNCMCEVSFHPAYFAPTLSSSTSLLPVKPEKVLSTPFKRKFQTNKPTINNNNNVRAEDATTTEGGVCMYIKQNESGERRRLYSFLERSRPLNHCDLGHRLPMARSDAEINNPVLSITLAENHNIMLCGSISSPSPS
ncbi:hypothetical protein PoB_000041100 [Plakobranchus ocellatus]|uniref:Uncharacterized protein n=1 Tax=Plakobranchus ocellatus TaxID=259542 RepID=A0AAV3XSB8_9GAST|nr:hypothetical protein PoB_000041100 [Plakobranchus ocellatus]